MVKLKKLRLQNYCGYRDSEFDFTEDGEVKNFAIFFGANGSGKSTILNAVRLLGQASRYEGRDHSISFNKMVFSENYEPTSQQYKAELAAMIKKVQETDPNNPLYKDLKKTEGFGRSEQMLVEGIYTTDEGDKRVVMNNSGVVLNELPAKPNGYAYYVDADHPMEMNKFQLENNDLADIFLELAKIVYNYPCFFDKSITIGGKEFFTDFCIQKWGTTVHHKSMSDGEKKICALLKSLCDPEYVYNTSIILIDNIEMHIYFKRHAKMFDALKHIFSKYQIITTTHSGTLIDHVNEKYQGKYLYDLEVYKKKEFEKFKVTENLGMG